jgi:hypothetical protein
MTIFQADNIVEKIVRTHNTGLAKVAVQCSADPDASGWFSASIRQLADFKSSFVIEVPPFANLQNVIGHSVATS